MDSRVLLGDSKVILLERERERESSFNQPRDFFKRKKFGVAVMLSSSIELLQKL